MIRVTTRHSAKVAARALVLALVLGAPAGAGAAAPRRVTHADPADWLVWDPSANTVTLTLIAGYNMARRGLNFNGYSTGTMVVSVPVGIRVDVVFRNDGASPHSALVTGYNNRSRDAARGFPLAFPGAYTPVPERGIARGRTQTFSFVASRQGRYAIVCSVDDHARAGMWDTLEVTAGGDPLLSIPR